MVADGPFPGVCPRIGGGCHPAADITAPSSAGATTSPEARAMVLWPCLSVSLRTAKAATRASGKASGAGHGGGADEECQQYRTCPEPPALGCPVRSRRR
ncbi:hypothetical protein GCM10027074_11260 [Streptomyces deserti]